MTLRMPDGLHPVARPHGVGTDDYRCFLLDPHLTQDAFLTGTYVLPGNPNVVHHVILFRVRPDQVAAARGHGRRDPGRGLDLLRRHRPAGDSADLDDAPWLGAWAPGGTESVDRARVRRRRSRPGSQIIMQVHYNLLGGARPRPLRDPAPAGAAARAHLTPLDTMLLPAPVELPCRRRPRPTRRCATGTPRSPTCARGSAPVRQHRQPASTSCAAAQPEPVAGDLVHPAGHRSRRRSAASPVTCTCSAARSRSWSTPAPPGRGRSSTSRSGTSTTRAPSRSSRCTSTPGDTVKVTCQHVQWLRDRLPAFQGQPERYVVWGEGTTDEMCLGILQVAFDPAG